MQTERNKSIVRSFVEAINNKDWDRLDGIVAPGFVRHSHAAGTQVRSRDELKAFLRQELETFPDARETIQFLLAEDDKVAGRMTFQGTQSGPMGPFPPSGRTLTSDYLFIYRLEGGQIVEAWAEWDNLSSLAQLGHDRPSLG